MLRIEDVQVRYGDFIAVSSVSLSVEQGQVAALIGANGAGKSSLLSAVCGLVRPAAGKVYFDGCDITGLPADKVVERGLCLVPQGGRCFTRMSVYDNLMIGSYPKAARKEAAASLERVYSLFPVLAEKRGELAGSLSGGQRQMLAIGRALMTRPRCVVFDEISLGLAPIAIKGLYERILQINRDEGITVVVVEQDTERALRIADTCFVITKGAIALQGKASQMSDEAIRSAFFGLE